MSYQLSNDHRLRRRRPGAASSAEQQRFEIHRSFRRDAAVVEGHRRRMWASKTESHRVCVFRPRLAEYVATTIKKASHVLIEGSLVSTTYERGIGKGKKAKTNKQTFWCIRADVVRKLDRGEPETVLLSRGRVRLRPRTQNRCDSLYKTLYERE